MLKARADLVTHGDHGAGVVELIDRIIASDLADLGPRIERRPESPCEGSRVLLEVARDVESAVRHDGGGP